MLKDTTHTCPIDWKDLFDRIPDEEIITEFADSFVKNSRKIMISLQEAIAAGDAGQIELYAHALKGSSSNIGAIPLAKVAWQLEKTSSEKQLDSAQKWLTKIQTEFAAVDALLQKDDWIQHAKAAVSE